MNRTRWFRVIAIGLVMLSAVGATVALQRNFIFQAFAATPGPALTVNATMGLHPISPDIYGMNTYGIDPAFAQELHLPVQRWGGDGTSRYNWLTDSSNAGFDWYFMGGGNANPVAGAGADNFINATKNAGGKAVLTIPLIDYVDKGGASNCSFPVNVYGSQQSVNPYVHPNGTDCGNSLKMDGSQISDTNIAWNNIPNSPNFQKQWIQHLISTHGTAANGGVNIYQMDNEPSGWGNTHRDIHPGATGYDELVGKTIAYASMIKSVDASANVLGPSDFGWPAYLDSSKTGDNAASHGGTKFAEYYLQQMHAYEQQHGVRLLNYFDEHYYPSSSDTCIALCPAGNAQTQAERLQSTRSLWDPTYKDNSWIGQYYQPIQLLPLFHSWVNKDYPGTKIAITEYNFGGVESINGALAQADVLGIFGREQLDLATMWGPPTSTQPGAFAFRMYRNYDGHGSSYGDTWVQSASADQGQLAIYGATRSSDGALTLMVINKTGNDLTSNLALSGFAPGSNAQVYTYSSANLNAIVQQPNLNVSANGFSTTYAANSISLVVLPKSGKVLPSPTASSTITPPTATATVTTGTPTAPHTTTIADTVRGNGLNQFSYKGKNWGHCTNCGSDLYNHSNSWDRVKNQYVTVTFVGTQILFYGVIDPRHGIGAVSIDGGKETLIDFYSRTRAGNRLLWKSPLLSPGKHTFKLRVTGMRVKSSSNSYVAVNRVDIVS